MTSKTERLAQKSRTRDAILAGARALMAEGAPVTVTAAAAHAGISKATAYRYFSDPGVLAAEAGLAIEVMPYDEVVAEAHTTRQKLRAVSLYLLDLSIAHEHAFRAFLARSLDAWAQEGAGKGRRRGARRVAMFKAALDDMAGRIGRQQRDRLVRALATATAVEAMIALFDVVGTDANTARETVLDITDALIDRHLGPDVD